MSIFKVLEANIEKASADYDDYLDGLKGDVLKGCEFMLYSLCAIFKDKNPEEIETGIVDSSYRKEKYDFGIDAIFVTAANDFIETPEELQDYNEDTKFKIHIFQFKKGTGVSQADILKLHSGVKKVLIEEDLKESDNQYFHDRMLQLDEIKNALFTSFSSENIMVICHVVFGGLKENVLGDPLLTQELTNIEKSLKSSGFVNTKIVITDCQGLINASSGSEQIVDVIEYQKTFKYITDTDARNKLNGYISIVNGRDVAELVRKHQNSIFEANIRDYYKRNDINSKITATSSNSEEAKFFWSYNNGLTMTCSKVEEMPNNKYRLHNLQIVNGCQTSNAIYIALKNKERIVELNEKIVAGKDLTAREQEEYESKKDLQFNDATSLLVKIIETNNEDFIYKITETTNSQTPIKAFSLKANDDIQKLIEKYLENAGICYERRINNMRNKGKKNIYSIQRLFQVFTSQILFKPSQVRTTPKRLFINSYDTVFPEPHVKAINFSLYLVPINVDIALNKAIKDYYKNNEVDNYKKTLISYGKLHLGVLMLSSILKSNYEEKAIVEKEIFITKELTKKYKEHFNDAIENLERIIKSFAGAKKEAIPGAVRKTELDGRLVRFIKGRK